MENRIRQLREENRMTQVRLSIELEVAQETISAYESGKHYPSIPNLVKMTKLFHTSADYILGITDCRLPNDTIPGHISGPERLIIENYRELPRYKQDLLKTYLLGLSEKSDF